MNFWNNEFQIDSTQSHHLKTQIPIRRGVTSFLKGGSNDINDDDLIDLLVNGTDGNDTTDNSDNDDDRIQHGSPLTMMKNLKLQRAILRGKSGRSVRSNRSNKSETEEPEQEGFFSSFMSLFFGSSESNEKSSRPNRNQEGPKEEDTMDTNQRKLLIDNIDCGQERLTEEIDRNLKEEYAQEEQFDQQLVQTIDQAYSSVIDTMTDLAKTGTENQTKAKRQSQANRALEIRTKTKQ